MQNQTSTSSGFIFADKLRLDDPKSRAFFNSLLRGFTHKLNNLLAVVEGFSSLILMGDNTDEGLTESVTHMKDASKNATTLCQRILTAGGCLNLTPQNLRVEDFLNMMESSLREPFTKAGVSFELSVPTGLPEIWVDASRLKEVLMELLKNAAEAAAASNGRAGLQAHFGGNADPSYVYLLVHNTGPEIAPERIQEVFKPFYTTKDSTHYGLGLTIASVLAGQMNMQLGVRSENGQTSFLLALPVAGG